MMSRCTGNCDQGRRVCNCSTGMPRLDVPVVDLAYRNCPFPRVARWVDEHPSITVALMTAGALGVNCIGAWLDGGAP